MSDAIERLLALIPPDPVDPELISGNSDDTAHDAYFHVTRIKGDASTQFIRMALTGRSILLEEIDESPAALAKPLLDLIDRAFADLLSCGLGSAVGHLPSVTTWQSRGDRQEVMPRWIRGHQVFAALTQGLVLSFQSMGRAIRAGDVGQTQIWADLTISLLRGSGASFVLTGDFSVQNYNEFIRPSMMPPASPICLSGLMSVDHRVLVQCIRDLKPALKFLHDHERQRHDQIHEELKVVYDRHIFVCERFVGKRPSLLTAGSTEKSGPELIQQFKTMRLKPFETASHSVRVKAQPATALAPMGCPFAQKPNE
jgi:hypothetical protein